MSEQVWVALITAAASIIGAIIAGIVTANKKAHDAAVALEKRLTRLEERQQGIVSNMFTKEDRACLQELKLKVEWFISFKQEEAAKALKNPPHLDVVLKMLETQSVGTVLEEVDEAKMREFTEFLEEKAEKDRSLYKREHARYLLKLIQFERKLEQDACA